MKRETMQITFGGQEHQIDANTLINSLIHYSTIISETNKELSGGSKQVSVKINAIKPGSFVIDISLVESVMGIFASGGMSYLADVITVAGGVFGMYKFMKGKPATEEDAKDIVHIDVKGDNNHVTYQNIVNVYNNRPVREAISKSIETANEDSSVEGITISDGKLEPIVFEKKEFESLIYTDFDTEIDRPDEIDEYVEATLYITGLNFEPGKKWSFVYNGFKIGMIVKDDALMTEIAAGARFGKGDSIRVKMKITKKMNPIYNVYENKSFKIVEFYEHIIGKNLEQGRLDM